MNIENQGSNRDTTHLITYIAIWVFDSFLNIVKSSMSGLESNYWSLNTGLLTRYASI